MATQKNRLKDERTNIWSTPGNCLRNIAIGTAAGFISFEAMECLYSVLHKGFEYPIHAWWHSDVWPTINALKDGYITIDNIPPRYIAKMVGYAPLVYASCHFSVKWAMDCIRAYEESKKADR